MRRSLSLWAALLMSVPLSAGPLGCRESSLIDLGQDSEGWAAWSEAGDRSDTILASRWNGSGWNAPARVSAVDSGANRSPALALGVDGLVRIAWIGGDGGLYLSTGGTEGWATPEVVSDERSGENTHPAVAVSRSGEVRVAWAKTFGSSDEIVVSRRVPAGWSDPEFVSEPDDAPDVMPAIAFTPAGALLAAWIETNDRGTTLVTKLLGGAPNGPQAADLPPPVEGPFSFPSLVPAGSGSPQPLAMEGADLTAVGPAAVGADASTAPAPAARPEFDERFARLLSLAQDHQVAIAWMPRGQSPRAAKLARRDLPYAEGSGPAGARAAVPRLFARSAPFSPAGRPSRTLRADTFVAIGDSITYGKKTSSNGPESAYPHEMEKKFRRKWKYKKTGRQFESVNEAVPGEITQEGLARLAGVLESDVPAGLTIMEGVNDFVFGVSTSTVESNLRRMIETAVGYGVYPSISTITPVMNRSSQESKIESVNSRILSLAREKAIPSFDSWSKIRSDPSWKTNLMADDVHPNSTGHTLIGDDWASFLYDYPDFFTP